MGIELAGIIGLLLLAPGFCMALAMRVHSSYGFQSFGVSKISTVIFLLLCTTILQIFIFPIYISLVEFLLYNQDLHWNYPKTFTIKDFFKWNTFNFYLYWFFATYILFSFGCGYILGLVSIKAIESGILPIPYFHGAMYPLIKGKKKEIKIVCSIFTEIQHEGCFLMYKGTLEEISYISRNKLDYVALSGVSVFLSKFDTEKLTTETLSSLSRKENSSFTPITRNVTYYSQATNAQLLKELQSRERFFINGEDIVNILFSKEIGLVSAV